MIVMACYAVEDSLKRISVVVLVALAAVISCGTSAKQPASAGASRSQAGRPELSQGVTEFKGGLSAISADSGTDVWATGEFAILHWNGKKWSAVPDPVPGTAGGLKAVKAFSKANVWIAGIGKTGAFIVHWNGSKWTRISTPALANTDDLSGIVGSSPASVWAVGMNADGSAPAILHWNGKTWSRVKASLPRGANGGYLNSVAVLSPTDAWAAGAYETPGASHTLVLHWNGVKWSPVASPSPGTDAYLNSVSASPAGIWAAGVGGSDGADALALRWNGKAWTKVAIANPAEVYLYAVTALSPTSAWAIGDYSDSSFLNPDRPLTMHWNGKVWSRAANPAPRSTHLVAMTVISRTSIWVAGQKGPGIFNPVGVLLHWNGKAWS